MIQSPDRRLWELKGPIHLLHKRIEGESGGIAIDDAKILRIREHIECSACYGKAVWTTDTTESLP